MILASASGTEEAVMGSLMLWIALAGLPVLAVCLAGHFAGRPLLPGRSARFGRMPASVLLMLALVAYSGSMVCGSLIVNGAAGAVGRVLGVLLAAAMVILLRREVFSRLLHPVGSVAGRAGTGLLVLWIALPFVYGALWVLQSLVGVEPQSYVESISERETGWQWIAIGAVLVAPVLEEVTIRGLLYPGLRALRGPRFAAVLSGAFFGLMHFDAPHAWAPLAIFGVFLAYLVETTGSLLAPIAAHSAFNLLTVGELLVSGGG